MEEKALRNAQIRRFREMGELKWAQELRVNEFSVQKLRKSHDTIQRISSQMQEMLQEVDSNYSGKMLPFPVNEQSFQVHVLC